MGINSIFIKAIDDDDEEEDFQPASRLKSSTMDCLKSDSDGSPAIGAVRSKKRKQPQEKLKSGRLPSKKLKAAVASDDDEEWMESSEGESEGQSDDDFVGEDSPSDEEDNSDMAVSDDDSDFKSKKKRNAPSKKSSSSTSKTPNKKPPLPPGDKSKDGTYKFYPEETPKGKAPISVTPGSRPTTATPNSLSHLAKFASTSSTDTTALEGNKPQFVLPEGVVGAGSHEHNSFEFLKPENIRDANGLRPDNSNYNPRTLKVPASFLNEQTPAMAQWWYFKAANMDTVLFFKVGKFYELFHMDADIGFAELDLIYMKGTKAHSGFPEVSYGKYSSILVTKGYRVARVEQTETPEMLKERNDSKGGKKDKVVARELCSIMTKGTRTYCHLDDLSILEECGNDNVSTSLLVSIKEIIRNASQSAAEDSDAALKDGSTTKPHEEIIEYGITCVDTVVGSITFAQFQDDQQCSRLRTFLARFVPTEVLLEFNNISEKTLGAVKLLAPKAVIEYLRKNESPTAMNTLQIISKAQYFGKLPSDQVKNAELSHYIKFAETWPPVLKAIVEGLSDNSSELVLLSFGAALWQLRRSLIDYEVLSLGKCFAYVPPDETAQALIASEEELKQPFQQLPSIVQEVSFSEQMLALSENSLDELDLDAVKDAKLHEETNKVQAHHRHMVLDEVALTNLEVLVNNYNRTEAGSLWNFVNRCKTLGGRRLLRSWLCRPLFSPLDIAKRRVAVEELLTSLASESEKARGILKNVPDLERLLARVHSNGIKRTGTADHPDNRAVMYEATQYNIRKIKDFVDILGGLESVVKVCEVFAGLDIQSPLLRSIIKPNEESLSSEGRGGRFPLQEVKKTLHYFREIFDEKQAKQDGNIKPKQGVNVDYDTATATVSRLKHELESYLRDMRKVTGISDINFFSTGKDRYQLEVPLSKINRLPSDWYSKSKKSTHQRFWTPWIEGKLSELTRAEAEVQLAQKDTLRSIFEMFDHKRHVWSTASTAISLLDALLALAAVSSLPGYVWPEISEKGDSGPVLSILGGRHPMLEYSLAQR